MCDYFYMRVSTQSKGENGVKEREQTFERQKGILERAGYVLTSENTFADRISGKTDGNDRKEFERLLSILKEGQTVVFTETSRFSRSYILGMQMLDTLVFEKKVNVKFVSNGISLYADTRWNPYTWYTVSQMLLADELQRRVISYNTVNGLQRKKEMGVVLGAPKTISDEITNKICELKAQGLKQKDIAKQLGISPATVSREVNRV